MAMRQGTPLPSLYIERTVWPGPFGATMKTSCDAGGTIWPKWMAKPWAKRSFASGFMFGATFVL